LQVWNHWNEADEKLSKLDRIRSLANAYHVPVLINNDLGLLKEAGMDGIHFDAIPEHFGTIRSELPVDTIFGITCGNDYSKVEWAIRHRLDYISFCSVFPSSSVQTCDLVNKELILKATATAAIPVFLSGGIHLDNIEACKSLGTNGIAVISGIMSDEDPETKTKLYKQALEK